MRIADLFAGAGGVTEGARSAGFDVVFAADYWKAAVDFHALRHPTAQHVCQDLHEYDFSAMPDHDILWASPSCQGHSLAAQPGRRHNEDLAQAHIHLRTGAWAVTRAVEAKRPKAFVVENVPQFQDWRPPGILLSTHKTKEAAEEARQELIVQQLQALVNSTDELVVMPHQEAWGVARFEPKGALYRAWKKSLQQLGYQLSEQQLVASHWGVPQRRHRWIVVGVRGHAVPIQEPGGAEPTLEGILNPTAGDWTKIEDMRASSFGARQRVEYAHKMFGGEPCWGHHVSYQGGWANGLDRSSSTVTTKDQYYMVEGGRYRLWTVPETAQVMGFRPDYFDGVCRTTAIKMAGNAVPPPLAAGVLTQVAAALR